MPEVSTDRLELAARFVNSTASHIFLTGKAGTGKTTFLHNLARATHKNYVVVAPTGIAALNAKGVTIHSQFLLPFGSYLPEPVNFSGHLQANFYSRKELASRHSLNKARKDVLRSIDLLIIDEVSMLRADLLDAIDYRLRSAKGNYHQAFGGVQLLMIGDLYQLPPIVKDAEWEYLKQFYASPHFFESRALKEQGFTYIELDRIFRQQDDRFIHLLNALRDDRCTAEDLAALNEHYEPNYQAAEGEITLTTHNYQADRLNREALDRLPGPSFYYEAEIDKDFPENLYPLPESLELREGAQVMFIKNDSSEQRYYNGKLATVKELTEDGICVSMEDEKEFWLDRHTWENKKYEVDEQSREVKEEVVGTFTQFPLRLAWAITVHKSQGLTFDRAVIDVGRAFAPGQVYVALSRLRSLEGLRLCTRISERVISSDAEVVKFSRARDEGDALASRLEQEQTRYLQQLLRQTFDFEVILKQIDYTRQKMAGKFEFEDEEMRTALERLQEAFQAEAANTAKFRHQLERLLLARDTENLNKRIRKGSEYYLQFLQSRLQDLLIHHEEVDQLSRTKAYRNLLDEIDQLISVQMTQVQKLAHICSCVIAGEEVNQRPDLREQRQKIRDEIVEKVQQHLKDHPKNLKTKTGRKKKKAKGETYQTTFSMLREGLSPEQIAGQRGLALTTIEGHLAKGVAQGELEIKNLVPQEEMKEMAKVLSGNSHSNLTEAFKALDGKYSYGKLRIVQASLRSE